MKKRRFAMIAVGLLIVIFMALEVFLCVWFFAAKYPKFDELAQKGRALEGLGEGFVPQGLAVADDVSLVSGYMAKKGPSRVYLLGETGKYVTVKRGETALTSHFGGVAVAGDNVYLTDGAKIVRLSLAEMKAAENGGAVTEKESFSSPLSNAYLFAAGDTLYAGEFYRKGNYETDPSHHRRVGGETNYAYCYAYEIGEGGALSGPVFGYSVRGLVQGFAVSGGKVYLSCSYGLADSELLVYDDPAQGGTPAFTENGIPMYSLEKANRTAVLTMPSMSEGICVKGEDLVVLFESDCVKYRHFVRRTIDELILLPLSLEA